MRPDGLLAYDREVSLTDWLRRVFSSPRAEDEAAAREEYGIREPDPLRRGGYGDFASREGVEAAEEGLDELRPPPDPAP